ncbi:2-polyprenyl-3-methyl-6-methoxy-1,4-benzoquinone monooxygenase [Microbulbifer sp. ZKSA002]|uniref:2-polyprenyl-3-methyl-6-methoxy-1,4-benzoquinone monooxygenase n=1 Tax=Microbulbifer sp. ZKSA002 TaxID=3243388 RepID=UPI0040393F6E
MSKRSLNGLDRLLIQADRALRTLSPGEPCHGRASPAKGEAETDLTDSERKHAAGLMRVNHSGEVCAQALYQGQALTAKLPEVRGEMERAADEEIDHLAWCEQRLKELDSRPSLLNPLWYGMSFGLGAAAGKISDRISLGFVAATEDQVCKHLESHLEKLPADDKRSRAVVEQMLIDEDEHAHAALAAGGARFPAPVKGVMSLVSKVMTSASYKI